MTDPRSDIPTDRHTLDTSMWDLILTHGINTVDQAIARFVPTLGTPAAAHHEEVFRILQVLAACIQRLEEQHGTHGLNTAIAIFTGTTNTTSSIRSQYTATTQVGELVRQFGIAAVLRSSQEIQQRIFRTLLEV